MAVAGAKVPLFKDHFWHFQIKIRPWKKSRGRAASDYRMLISSGLLSGKYYFQVCQWDLCDCARAGRHAGKSICQHDWSHRQHNKFYRKSPRQKFLFFWRLKRDLSLNFCVCHKKRKSWSELNIVLLLFICKMHLIYCKVLKVFNFILFSSF